VLRLVRFKGSNQVSLASPIMSRFHLGRRSLATALAAGSVVLVLPGAASAKSFVFTVNTSADSHDATPGNRICANSSGRCSLRAAIEESNTLPAGTSVTVTVPAGTYQLSLGALAIAHNAITIKGAGAANTTVRQSGSGAAVPARPVRGVGS
jgi:CSLREA domain-containing protein